MCISIHREAFHDLITSFLFDVVFSTVITIQFKTLFTTPVGVISNAMSLVIRSRFDNLFEI